MTVPQYAIIAAVNDDAVLQQNLAASPLAHSPRSQLLFERNHPSASRAYNAGLAKTTAPYAIFAHQDVYLPLGWDQLLGDAIAHLNATDPAWAVLGPFGVTPAGKCIGRAWSSGLHAVVGTPIAAPEPVVSFDELVFVLNTSANLRFDDNLPGFHLYGTDIVQIAKAAGRTAYAFDAPVVHNSRPIHRLDKHYRAAYHYMRRKWAANLPIPTSVMPLTPWGTPLYKNWLRATARKHLKKLPARTRHPSPATLAEELGFTPGSQPLPPAHVNI